MNRISVALTSALFLAGASAHAQPPKPAPLTPQSRQAVIDTVAKAVTGLYVLQDPAKAMGSALINAQKSGRYDSILDPNALAGAINRTLRSAHRDTHLRVVYDPEEAARAADTTRREARDTRARDRKMNFQFSQARILPGNVGYIEFYQFADTSEEARRTVRAAMQFVANSDALILDLRDNRGGSVAMAREISSYFVKDSAMWSRTYNRLTDRWTDDWIRNDPVVTGGTYLGMPISVLTSAWTFSAAEGLAYALKHERGAVIIGDSTAGGAHTVRRVPLVNGFVGFIPYIRPVNLKTNTNWEGTGVVPDHFSEAPAALLRAQELIFNTRIASASDTMARKAAEFALNAARAEAGDVDVPGKILGEYAGTFEEYTFSVRGNRLYSVNRSRNNRSDKLEPISPALFQIDRESQVEFARDGKGLVSKIRIFWNDGWVDTIDRTKPGRDS